jgi:hypothetical protein
MTASLAPPRDTTRRPLDLDLAVTLPRELAAQ